MMMFLGCLFGDKAKGAMTGPSVTRQVGVGAAPPCVGSLFGPVLFIAAECGLSVPRCRCWRGRSLAGPRERIGCRS